MLRKSSNYDDQKPAEEKRPQEHEDITLPHPNQYLPKIEEAPLKPETDLSVFGEKKEEEKPSYEQPHEPEHKPEPEHKQ